MGKTSPQVIRRRAEKLTDRDASSLPLMTRRWRGCPAALHDDLHERLADSADLLTKEASQERDILSTETFGADSDDAS